MSRRHVASTLLLLSLFARGAAAQGPAGPAEGAKGRAAGAAPAEVPASDGPAREPTAAELEVARALFEEARKDEAARRWGEALVKFRRIQATKDTASLRFHLAYCEENMGLVASAVRDYERAAELAQGGKGPDRKLIVEDAARSRAELAPRVPTLALELPAGVEGARVSVDGEPVAAERLSAALPLDPGRHAVEVSAPGRRLFQREVRLSEREKHTLSVVFEPAVALAPPAAPGPRRDAPAKPVEGGGGGVPAGVWVAGGAGVAFAGAAAGLLAKSLSQRAELDACGSRGGQCEGSQVAAASNRNMALAGVAGGLSAAGAGVAIWLALKGPSKAASKAPVTGLVLGPSTLGWRGSF